MQSTATSASRYCRIRVNPAVASGPISYLVVVLAHEVFHCFEFDLDPAWASQGDWLIEGMAEWAALSVDPVMSPMAEADQGGARP